jgi:hypothetical protein
MGHIVAHRSVLAFPAQWAQASNLATADVSLLDYRCPDNAGLSGPACPIHWDLGWAVLAATSQVIHLSDQGSTKSEHRPVVVSNR